MGYSKKGIRMKINNFITSSVPIRNKAPQSSGAFGNLLDVPHTTGDEFYWQHQDQLQKSKLEFKLQEKISAKIPINLYAYLETNTPALAPTPLDNINPCASTIYFDTQSKQEVTDHTEPTLLNKVIRSQDSLPAVDTQKPTKTTSKTSTENLIKPENKFCQPIRKKHHLFIDQDQAELSLNLDDMKLDSKKELIQTFKTYLKEKGMILKKLIINGVNHG